MNVSISYGNPPRPPCTVCGAAAEKHGTYPTCASHPYTPDGMCGYVVGATCVGAECRDSCVRGRREGAGGADQAALSPPAPVADVVHGEIVMRVDADRLPHGATLHLSPPAGQEPVAWQWRKKGEPWTLERTFNSEVFATTPDTEVRALFANPVQHQQDALDALRKIAAIPQEAHEWDAVVKFREAQAYAVAALSGEGGKEGGK